MSVNRPFIFFGGKGGTGKTTCAAAYAYWRASQGSRTLVVSTDPAHSLADAMGVPIGPEIVRIRENLWGIEIDAELESRKYVKSIQDKMLSIVSAGIADEIKRQIEIAYASPGAEEAAIFDKFVELMESIGDPYDMIVFDTAPTGHTLRLLSLPEILGAWIEHLIDKRAKAMHLMEMAARYDRDLQEKIKDDPIITTLRDRHDKFVKARGLLTDPEKCVFCFVLNAEKLPIVETQRAVALLEKYGIPIGSVVVNKVFPPESGSFFRKHRESQMGYLARIESLFGKYGVICLPFLESDIQGMQQISIMADRIKEIDVR